MSRHERDRDGSGILLRVAQRSGATRKRYSGQPDGGTDDDLGNQSSIRRAANKILTLKAK